MKYYFNKTFLKYMCKWQLGFIVAVPCLYFFIDVLEYPLWLSTILFNFVGAVIFYPIDVWILKNKKSVMDDKDRRECQIFGGDELSEDFKKVIRMKNKKTENTEIVGLGYDYVYHFNPYSNEWSCIHRDSYTNYWNRLINKPTNWTSSETLGEAQRQMIKNLQAKSRRV